MRNTAIYRGSPQKTSTISYMEKVTRQLDRQGLLGRSSLSAGSCILQQMHRKCPLRKGPSNRHAELHRTSKNPARADAQCANAACQTILVENQKALQPKIQGANPKLELAKTGWLILLPEKELLQSTFSSTWTSIFHRVVTKWRLQVCVMQCR